MTDTCRVPHAPDPEFPRLTQAIVQMAHVAGATAETLRTAFLQATRAAQRFAAVWQAQARPEDEGDAAP
jgi:lactate dehydrogenase-like 2-hydroxyacid dehydrogenase